MMNNNICRSKPDFIFFFSRILQSISKFYIIGFLAFPFFTLNAQQLAFPSAEGYGRFTTGGRGGEVYIVTNLNDDGEGSFREAVEASGKRTIVFAVSGTIALESRIAIKNGDLTIAGQTAPGDGICIRNYPLVVDANNVIVRYMRFRLGDEAQTEDDAFWGRRRSNIIIDHCSMSWSVDECASFYDNTNFTMQWCILSESLYHSVHGKGNHGYGGIWGGLGATFHHNLLAHHTSRNPRFCGSRYNNKPNEEIVDFVNNVIYNWGFNSSYGGEGGNQNIRANYYKYGPATDDSKKFRIVEPYDTASNWYVADNFIYGYPEITADNWNGGVQGSDAAYLKTKMSLSPFPIADVNTQNAEEAYELVLKNAGVIFPLRDSLDERIINETRTGTAKYGATYKGGGKGIIDSQTDVGGWPVLNSLPAKIDSDSDGIPDEWEEKYNLDPSNPDDRNNIDESGYTMLEVYINSLPDAEVTSVTAEENVLPERFEVGNYPNPFNPSTTITYRIPEAGSVKVDIFSVTGELVKSFGLMNHQSAGEYSLRWNGRNNRNSVVNTGVYFAVIKYNRQIKTLKLLLLN